jgi:hypothetical protein
MTMTMDELKAAAAAIAEELKSAGEALTPDQRRRFIDVRAALIHRGIYDPILGRFDSYTSPRASVGEVAEQLATLAATL